MWQASKIQLALINEYAQYGYSPDRIAILINIWGSDKDDFMVLVRDESSNECQAFLSGEATGASNADSVLQSIAQDTEGSPDTSVAAVKELALIQKSRETKDLKRKLFGL